MDIINIKFEQTDAEIGSLGMQGENKKVALHVDCSGVLEKHPDAAILINYDRRFPGESYYNLPVTALENGIYEAVLTPMEMAYDGLKRIQVRAVEGDYEDRSKTFIAYVEKSVYDFRPPAGPVSDWLDQLQKALNQAEEAQQHGPVIGANGNWHVWQDGYYADTGVAAGSDISPEQIGEAVSDYLQQNPFQETDPTVPAWAKQPEKPSYTAQEVGAQPAGNYLTAETDPTVPDWAKAASKPSYTAAEVGALPSSTQIPKALSDLTQDTAHRTVTDAEKAAWNGKSNFSGSYNDLTDKPTIPDAYTLPIANASTLGGVKPVAKTDDMTQAVGVDALGALFTIPGGGGSGSGSESSGVKAELVYSFTADGETMSAFDDLAIEDGCVYAVLIAVPYNQGNTATTPVVNIIVATDQAVTYRGFPVAYVAGLAAWRDEFTCEMFTRNGSNMRMLTHISTEGYNKQWKGTYSGDKIYIYSSTADVNIISGTTVEVYKLV